MVECPCMLDKTHRHLQTSLYLSGTNEMNFCSSEQPQKYGHIFAAYSAGMQQGGLLLQHTTA